MTYIKQDNARVCVHIGCEIIFDGPGLKCPQCGWQGVTFKEIADVISEEYQTRWKIQDIIAHAIALICTVLLGYELAHYLDWSKK